MSSQQDDQYGFKFYSFVVFFVGISIFELFALFHWGSGEWLDKLHALLALVGAYGIALGLGGGLAAFKQILTGLTDPNPVIYLRSNLAVCATLLQFGVLGTEKRMEDDAPRGLWIIGLFAWLPAGIILMVYTAFHLLIITPLAYIPLVTASAVIAKMRYAAGDIIVSLGENRVSIKSVVSKDTGALTGFVVGIPSLALSLIGTIVKVI